MNKKVIIAILIVLMLILGGAAIYIAVNLTSQTTVIPDGAKAYSFTEHSCSGGCSSGRECNQYGDPSPGTMWSCWPTGGVYKCAESGINEGGDSCWGCPGSMQPCGCDEGACQSACLAKISGSSGSATHTMLCTTCQQKFTCSCSKSTPSTPTNTPTPTPSKIKCGDTGCVSDTDCEGYNGTQPNSIWCSGQHQSTNPTRCIISCPEGKILSGYCACITITPTLTPTNTPTITPSKPVTTIPQTALITDEADRILIGIGMIFVGILFYKTNLYYSAFFFFKNTFVEKPKKNSVDKFEEKVQKKYKNK